MLVAAEMEIEMANNTGLLRRVVDALVTGRQRAAQRYVDAYIRDHDLTPRRDAR